MRETIKQQLENADRLKEQGQFDEAISAYQEVIQLDPQNHQSHISLGEIFLGRGKYSEAKEVYRQAIDLSTNNAWSHCNLGRSLLNLDRVSEAISCLQKAIALDPSIAEFYYYLGSSLTKQNRFEDAISPYRKAIELEPNKFLYHHQLGDCLLIHGKYEEAISFYQKALELNPTYTWSYCNWGNALSQLERLDEAVTIYLKGLQQIPCFSALVSKLAIAQSQMSDEQVTANPAFSYLSKLRQLFQSEVSQAHPNRTAVTSVSPVEKSIFPELDDAGFIAWIFESLLKRSAADREISLFLKNFDNGSFSRASALENILKSKEFSELSGKTKASPKTEYVLLSTLADEEFVKYLYNTFLRRPADEEGLAACVEALKNNVSRSVILENIITSEEFSNVTSQGSTEVAVPLASVNHVIFSEMSDKQFIEYVYVTFLKHLPNEKALIGNLEALLNGTPRTILLENILKSEEFVAVNKQQILEGFSDREFLHIIWEVLLGVVCNVNAERHHLKLFDSGLSRSELAIGLMKSNDFIERVKMLPVSGDTSNIPKKTKNSAHILGTDRVIDRDEWNHILLEALLEYQVLDKHELLEAKARQKKTTSSDFFYFSKKLGKSRPLISIITSLYKGEKFINNFMQNITSQTIFRECELIIIDANSPEEEYNVIKQYREQFENIKYIRTDKVIGIYDAWNMGIEAAKGVFLTNANLDDLRSPDCLEKQSLTLLKNEDVDVVYQDVYYTFTPNLPFEVIARCNVKSQLPMATKANMLQFNSPHNAPMWRKSLHNKVGLFSTRYKSAGDYEMWLRAMLNGSKFLKIEEPLAAYYNNPFGISTRSDTSGVKEAIEIQRIYVKLFGASFFAMAKEDFISFCYSSFGLSEKMQQEQSLEKWKDKETFLYQVFNRKLQSLAEGKFYVSLEEIVV